MKLIHFAGILVIILLAFMSRSEGANILFVPPMLSPSHLMALLPWADALAERGHNVLVWEPAVYLNAYSPKTARLDHFQVKINTKLSNMVVDRILSHLRGKIWARDLVNGPHQPALWYLVTSCFCADLLESNRAKLDRVLHINWDIVIVDELMNPSGRLLTAYLRANYGTSLILYTAPARMTATAAAYNNIPSPMAYIARNHAAMTDRMHFFERSYSVLLNLGRSLLTDAVIWSDQLRYGAALQQPLDVQASFHNPDALSAAYLPELDFANPTMRNVIHIGGIHIAKSKIDLPKKFKDLIDQYPKGFILIGFGHWVEWAKAPCYAKQAFSEALGKLPADLLVIFQASGGVSNVSFPENVHIFEWVPQSSLLRK